VGLETDLAWRMAHLKFNDISSTLHGTPEYVDVLRGEPIVAFDHLDLYRQYRLH
jgi:hypothetical protein